MRNLTLLTDFYELTMMQGYFLGGKNETTAVFDLFYRNNPYSGAYAVTAGLASVIDYIENLHFSDDDIRYLDSLGTFKPVFLDYLRTFRFSGDLYAMPEGSVIFPNEPILKIVAPLCETQLIESALLNLINHQSLIATKASRIRWVAGDDVVLEFGLRRAQGPDASTLGARAAVIAGCQATSNVLAGYQHQLDVKGTHAHSWIMSFDSEEEAFRSYASLYPDACILLVDTYNTLKSGVPNAIKIFQEMKEAGISSALYGIRLDSGDLAYLSKKARKMLDQAGFPDAVISASSDLDEYLIRDMKLQGSKVTLWGVGTNLITSSDDPSFGGVYKLAALSDKNSHFNPKMKLSDNPAKVTNPGNKKVWRIYDKQNHKIKADLIALDHEQYTSDKSLLLFDPLAIWKKMKLLPDTYSLREMLVPIYQQGKLIYQSPSTRSIQAYCAEELATLWDESKRLTNPQEIYVDLSKPLYQLKNQLIDRITNY